MSKPVSPLKTFAPKPPRRVWIGAKAWIVSGHYRNAEGEVPNVTAAYLTESERGGHAKLGEVAEPRLVREACFDAGVRATRAVDVRAFRKVLGRPAWGKKWRPVPRKVLGAVFDLVLVRRALACAPRDGIALLQIVPFVSAGGVPCDVLRIVGDGWRIVVGGRTEKAARPLALAATQVRSEGQKPGKTKE